MAEAKKTETPVKHVYTGIAAILSSMSVEKGGTLPGNMGGKSYITAVDLSLEVKRKFVENNLIILPSEHVTRHEVVASGTRNAVVIGIEGTYQIVSTIDESSVTIGGVGDGLALGTAVASNIASTNALKNALLRTFLVTEQSVEDQAKNGIPDADPVAPKAASTQDRNADKADLAALRNTVKTLLEAKGHKTDAEKIAWGKGNGFAPGWNGTPAGLEKAIETIKAEG